jgi:hypothetical protein
MKTFEFHTRINLLTQRLTADFSGKTVKAFRSGGIFKGSMVSVRCGLQNNEFRSRAGVIGIFH